MSKGTALVVVDHQFEALELYYPYLRLKEEGYDVKLVGPQKDHLCYSSRVPSQYGYTDAKDDVSQQLLDQAWVGGACPARPCITFDDAMKLDNCKVLIVPGGVALPDRLRMNQSFIKLLQNACQKKIIVGMLGHAPWVAVSAGILKNRKITGTPAIRDDLMNAGAKFCEDRVCVDENLITGQTPCDLPQFMRTLIPLIKH